MKERKSMYLIKTIKGDITKVTDQRFAGKDRGIYVTGREVFGISSLCQQPQSAAGSYQCRR